MTTVSDAATARRCAGTPTISVVDNRGLTVRTVQYNRTAGDDPLDELITRQTWSARGHLMTRIDPRLFDEQRLNPTVPPNFRYVRSLSGQPLAIASQDAGEHTALYDVEAGLVWQHDSRHQQLRRTYDTLHRPVSVSEQAGPATPRVSERFLYGDADASPDANRRGQLRQAWSTAGMAEMPSYGLAGQPLTAAQQCLRDDLLDSDWAGDDPARWTHALAPDTYTTRWAYNALGQQTERTDACGNRQRQHYSVAGQLAGSDLQLADQATWQPLLRAITYSAAGQVLHEAAGNGVVTDYTYEPQTQRLAELHTTRPPQAGRTTLLQALSYQYDPVGNLLAIDDAAKATRYTRNQRVAPASAYTYDALYQLTRATGRENANAGRQSQRLPVPIVPLFQETGELTRYTRTYTYDRGANLTTLQHQGTLSSYTQQMVVARTSNRAVQQTNGLTPGDVAGHFDACGNLRALGPGQPLAWDSRNQLQRTAQVARGGAGDDTEVYWYDGTGQRATKLGTALTSGTTRTERVRYLPGLELRQIEQTRTGEPLPTPVERLQVLSLGAAGRQSVRVLHWELGKPETIGNDQWRVSLDDQIGSSMLELDAQADILTWEEYYPFGGTSVWSARSDTEAKYKYVRYSGQERDATGLYYYGFRYYTPWLGRWLNPDPAGPVDGLNLFCMVGNNPITFHDPNGLSPERAGHIYTPFSTKEILELAMASNLVRFRQGKEPYPVIVGTKAERKALERIRSQLLQSAVVESASYETALQQHRDRFSMGSFNASEEYEYAVTKHEGSQFREEVEVYENMTIESQQEHKALAKLRPEADKLYVLGHGFAGFDFLGGDVEGSTSKSADWIARELATKGLSKDFRDIRALSCYSANTVEPVSFEPAELARAAQSTRVRGTGTYRQPFAQSLRDALRKRGFNQVEVTGYHGAGSMYSIRSLTSDARTDLDYGDTTHLQTIIKGSSEQYIRRSEVSRCFYLSASGKPS
ncbi:RHS repeat-associated core domain-containing protein [Burkholderia sp. S-53]|uniref:RHS repeat-associated core domain-containing protein n=1 Tax=Burkholderia sp. S-53 TaxID=2906514 RepID=UPI0021D2E8B6|nr:RHS repeat-associated core domain-containing protein [Burkholderia sp. S-53]UXU85291.1 hypothetical protein LXM88_02675 [Burkholderia sp. S-53]